MLLRSCQNENSMCRRLLQCFEKRVECRCGEHMNLIYNIHFVFPYLRRNAYLINKRTDIIHGVVGRGIQFVNVVGTLFIESHTRFTLIAGFMFRCRIQAVDGFGKNTGTRCLSHTPRAAKQISMSEFISCNGIFKRSGQCLLPHH